MTAAAPESSAAEQPEGEVRPSQSGRLRAPRNALAGLLDAGFAALSSFLMGAAVVHLLPSEDLALFSSMFAGFVLCALLPAQLVYLPSQLHANLASGGGKGAVAPDLIRDLRHHAPIVLIAAVLAAVLGLPLAAQAGWTVYGFAAAGMFVLAITSPHQSHARGVLHIAGRHGGAAVTSVVTLIVQVALLVVAALAATDPVVAPALLGVVFLGAGLGNLAGTITALLLLRDVPRSAPVSMGAGTRLGYLGAEAIAQVAGYMSVLLVAAVLGPAAVATLEAARVAASPVQILVVGLLAYLSPKVVRAVAAMDRAAFRRAVVRTNAIVLVLGAAYALLLVVAGGFIGRILGRAVDTDLAAARAAVTTIDSTGTTPSLALLSMRRVVPLNTILIIANALMLAAMAPALLLLGAVGMPAAQALGSTVKAAGLLALARRAV